jgi:hypothetical protein
VKAQEDLDVGMSESEMVRHRLYSNGEALPEPRFPKEVVLAGNDGFERQRGGKCNKFSEKG